MRKISATILALALISCAGAACAHTSLDQPDGGELFNAGDEVLIRWHIWVPHDLQDWDLWFATDAPDLHESCNDQEGPGWTPIIMDIPPTCQEGGSGCGIPGGCTMEYVWTVPGGINSSEVKIRVRMDNTNDDYYDVSNEPFTVQDVTAVESPAVMNLRIEGNHPNPFNPTTMIEFSLPVDTRVTLRVQDVSGRNKRILVADVSYPAGVHQVLWDGRDSSGRRAPSGVYFARLEAAGEFASAKLTLLK